MLRDVAQGIADFIKADSIIANDGHVTVVVEDKADAVNEVQIALGQLGVCAVISIVGFNRIPQSPLQQGDLSIVISCYEEPALNRDDLSVLTAQGVAERLAKILHYHKFPFLVGQMLFQSFQRQDVETANIMDVNFSVNTALGYEDAYFYPETNQNETP